MKSEKINKIVLVLFMFSLVANIFFGINYFKSIGFENYQKNSVEALKKEKTLKTIELTKFFVEKIVKTGGQMTFEDRNKFESDIKALNDENISKQWQVFISSKDPQKAQESASQLLLTLIDSVEK